MVSGLSFEPDQAFEVDSLEVFVERLVAFLLADEEEIRARREHRFGHRLGAKQVVAQVDGPHPGDAFGVRGEPAFGSVAFAILLVRTVLRSDELRHQRHGPAVAGSRQRGAQHGMAVLDNAVAAPAG